MLCGVRREDESDNYNSIEIVKRVWGDAFRERAVPFADQLIDENHALFEERARL